MTVVSLPSEVPVGRNSLVASLGRVAIVHTFIAIPAAMAAPSTVISQKSGRTMSVCVCVWNEQPSD